jgi:hypothetical protein
MFLLIYLLVDKFGCAVRLKLDSKLDWQQATQTES